MIPHTSGNYSNASFKGSYVFQIHGFISSNLQPYREVGVITADGNGNITAGTDDLSVVGAGAAVAGGAITGTYRIANDGTGQIFLNSTALGSLFSGTQITLAVTLTSTSVAYMQEADFFADGAGTAELQDSTAIGATPAGAFVFRLHDDLNAQSSFESEVGIFTISGTNLSGSLDQNTVSAASSLTFTGNFTAPSASGVGTATFTDNSGTANATTELIYFIVNSTKFYFLVSNGPVGSGSAEAQTGNVSAGLAGSYVFGSRGDDLTGGNAAVATVGQFTGSGATISKGALDSMADGNYSGLLATLTGTPVGSPSAQGRVEVTLSAGPTLVGWLVSPARVYFLFENNGSAVEDGTADLQTGTSFTASTFNGQFAMIMDGVDGSPEAVSRVGLLQFDGSSHNTIVELVNDSGTGGGSQNPGALSGSYSVGSSGRIATQVNNTNGGGPDLVLYAISGSQAYALQIDAGTNTSGTIQQQQ